MIAQGLRKFGLEGLTQTSSNTLHCQKGRLGIGKKHVTFIYFCRFPGAPSPRSQLPRPLRGRHQDHPGVGQARLRGRDPPVRGLLQGGQAKLQRHRSLQQQQSESLSKFHLSTFSKNSPYFNPLLYLFLMICCYRENIASSVNPFGIVKVNHSKAHLLLLIHFSKPTLPPPPSSSPTSRRGSSSSSS